MKRSLATLAASAALAATLIVPAFAQNASSAASTMTKHGKTTVDTACMATAESMRDTAISTALQTVVTAIQKRGQDLSAAWGNADPKARKAAIKAANDAFKGTWQTFNTTRKNAWSQYKTAAKACHTSSTDVSTPNAASGL